MKTDYDPCPWWTTELHLLRRQLNVERNRLKKHPNNIACAIRVKILKREYRKLIRVEKRKVKIRLAEQAKDPWKILRRLNSKNVMTGVLDLFVSWCGPPAPLAVRLQLDYLHCPSVCSLNQ